MIGSRLYSYHRRNFWIFQIAGWVIFSFYAFLVTTTTVFTRASGVLPVMGVTLWLASGFALTLLLRTVYNSGFFKNRISPVRIGIAVLLPLALSSAWVLEFNMLNSVFLLNTRYTIFDSFKNFILDFVFVHGPFYLWTFFYFGIKSWYSFYDQKIKAEKALSMLNLSKLQMLRYQLNPHFLFNSLNSIKALIHENPAMAEITITSLSDFLRATLQYNEKLMIPLTEELKIIQHYLSIEKIRYEERLDYVIKADAWLLETEIPCLITQPLIENSIKHGLQRNPEGIKLMIRIFELEKRIVIEVSNSGRLSPDWTKGIGLANLTERLENSFPGRFGFSLEQEDHTVVARITLAPEI